MIQYIVRRLISMIPTLFGVSVVVFLFIHLIPGDPASAMLRENAPAEVAERIRESLGLNKPLYEQYAIYLGKVLRGDLGRSLVTNNPVTDDLANRLPATAELSILAMLIATLVGIPAGIISAVRRNSIIDTASMFLSLTGVSMPIFWLGLMAIYLFAVELHWVPSGTRIGPDVQLTRITNFYLVDAILTGNLSALGDLLHHLILPSIVLATVPMALLARMTRSSMLEALNQDYVRTAHAKGLRARVVIVRHALKNALLPIITVIGLQVGGLLSGAILTETIFGWPGVGRWVYDSIQLRDYPVVQGVTLTIALIFVFVNLLVDLSYAFVDPRIHYQ
jgi:peptide/nickel transport system permease protein